MLPAPQQMAEFGYAVFPCVPNAKNPLTPHGLNDATTDSEQIDRWLERWPSANWALRTDSLLVIDVDPTPEGAKPWLSDDHDKLLDLAAAPMVVTPRGGRHYYFRQPDGAELRNTQSELSPGVDTRADGGYVLIPPSAVDGKSYQWVEGELDVRPDSLPLPPQWLVDALTNAPTPTWRATGPGKIPVGQRNGVLFRLACSLRRPGLSQVEIAAALKAANLARCEIPLDEKEVERIAESAANYSFDVATAAKISGGTKKQATKPIIVSMADIQEQETEWLWDNHIPIGELTCIGGYQGLGKSFLTIDIAARLSVGAPWPGSSFGYVGGGDVILLSAEDDLARTIKPRLRAAGANLSRIHALQGVQFLDGEAEADFNLDRDLPALEQTVQQAVNPKLIIIDPISCYTGEIDDHKNKEVRSVLKPLRDLAERSRVAVIYITHLNRSESKNALNRISGSGAFTAAPRVAWTLWHPDPPPQNARTPGCQHFACRRMVALCPHPSQSFPPEPPLIPAPIDLRTIAGKRYRIEYEASHTGRAEDPWLLIIPCRYGHVYVHSSELLGVATDSRILGRKLARLPGVEIRQDGCDGMNLTFPPEAFGKVAAIIKPRRRRQLSAIQRERLGKYAFKPAARSGFEGQNRAKTELDVSLAG